MKNYTVTAMPVPKSFAGSRNACSTSVCHNLRGAVLPDGRKVLKAVGAPAPLGAKGRPVARHAIGADDYLFVVDGRRLCFVNLSAAATVAETAAIAPIELDSDFRCLNFDGRQLTIMADSGPGHYSFDAAASAFVRADIDGIVPFSLITYRLANASARLGGRSLSRQYLTGDHDLDPSDLSAVSADMRRAYLDCARQARMSGAFVAARFCRYRLVDDCGADLYVSPPQLLGADPDGRLTAPVTFLSLDRRRLEPLDVERPLWRPRLVVNGSMPEGLRRLVSRVEIDVSPGLHPYSADEPASAAVAQNSAGNAFLNVTAPGAWRSASAANGRGAVSLVMQLLGRLDGLWSTVAALSLDALGQATDVCCASYRTVADDLRVLDTALAKEPAVADPLQQSLSMPHGFTAAAVASGASVTLWGNITAITFDGYRAEQMAASMTGAGAWHAAVSVTFGDGNHRVVAVSQGLEGAPLTFGPLLSYPSPEARSMTIMLSRAGSVYSRRFDLEPDLSRRRAVYLSPDFSDLTLDLVDAPFVIPQSAPPLRPYPSALAMTRASAPLGRLEAMAVADIGGCEIKAIHTAARRNPGWESATQRFNIFGSTGIYAASCSGAGHLRTTLIDPVAVTSSDSVAMLAGRLLAVASGRLLEVRPDSTLVLLDDIDADTIACCDSRGEIWLGGRSTLRVVDASTLSCCTRSESGPTASVGSYAQIDGRIVNLDNELADNRYIRWVAEVDFGDGFVRVGSMTADIHADAPSQLEVALRRQKFDCFETFASSRVTVDGRLASPLHITTLTLPMRSCRLDLQGTTPTGTTIHAIRISLA